MKGLHKVSNVGITGGGLLPILKEALKEALKEEQSKQKTFALRLTYTQPVPEIIDPVFTKTSPKRSFCMTENERFGLVFTKTGSINSGTVFTLL